MRAITVISACIAMLALPLPPAFSAPVPLRRPFVMQRNLPYGTILAIAPDDRYVWFGGREMRPGEEHGIARFDRFRRSWQLFLESEGIIADEISALAVDGDDLWIGSVTDRLWNRGFYRYNTVSRTARRFQIEDGLPHWRVRGIAVLDNEVWAATMGGVARFCKRDETWRAYTRAGHHLATDFTTSIVADDRHVWIGSFSGIERYDRRRDTWRSFDRDNSLLTGAVTAMAQDSRYVWFLTPPHIIRFQRANERFERFHVTHPPAFNADVTALAVTEQTIWVGTTNGLHMLDRRTENWQTHTEDDGMVHRSVYTLAADEHLVWSVDPHGFGISCFDMQTRRWERHYYREGSPANHLYSLLLDGDRLYVGTLGSGFWMYHINRDEWVNLNMNYRQDGFDFHYMGHKSPIMHTDIRDLAADGTRVWLATNHGLCMHDPNGDVDFEVIDMDRFPMQSVAVFGGQVWCGGQQDGLRVYNPATTQWTVPGETVIARARVPAIAVCGVYAYVAVDTVIYRFQAADAPPQRIKPGVTDRIQVLLAHAGRLWIGTLDGLYIHDLNSGQTDRIADRNLPDAVIHALAYAQDRYWVGTEAGLATCEDPGGEWTRYKAPGTLTHPIVSSIVGDARYLWVGTLGGGMVRLTF